MLRKLKIVHVLERFSNIKSPLSCYDHFPHISAGVVFPIFSILNNRKTNYNFFIKL